MTTNKQAPIGPPLPGSIRREPWGNPIAAPQPDPGPAPAKHNFRPIAQVKGAERAIVQPGTLPNAAARTIPTAELPAVLAAALNLPDTPQTADPLRAARYARAAERAQSRTYHATVSGLTVDVQRWQTANLTAHAVDALDPEIAQFATRNCLKTGRPFPGMPATEVRSMISGLGRTAAFSRLNAWQANAIHPLWLHTDANALTANMAADPHGMLVYLLAQAADKPANEGYLADRTAIYQAATQANIVDVMATLRCLRHLLVVAKPSATHGSKLWQFAIEGNFTQLQTTLATYLRAATIAYYDILARTHRQTPRARTTAIDTIAADQGGASRLRSVGSSSQSQADQALVDALAELGIGETTKSTSRATTSPQTVADAIHDRHQTAKTALAAQPVKSAGFSLANIIAKADNK